MIVDRDNPVAALLQSVHRREGVDRYHLGALLLSFLVGGSGTLAAGGLAGLGLTAMVLLALVPFLRAQRDAALLVSLRHGRSLEEIRQTRLQPGEVVDGLAWHTLRTVLRSSGWLAAPGMALAWLLAAPGPQRSQAVTLAALWLPALLLVTLWQSYFASMLAAWTRDERSTAGQMAGVWLAVLPPTLATPWALVLVTRGQTPLGLALLLAGGLWIGLVSRSYALAGLRLADRLQDALEQLQRRLTVSRNRWIAPWNSNPIVFREMSREASRTPGGVLGMLASRFFLAVLGIYLPSFGLIHLTELGMIPRSWGVMLWLGMCAFLVVLQPVRAGGRLSAALVEEREKRTLESLVATRLTSREFVTGWAGVGWIPRCQENILAVMGLLVMAAYWSVPLGIVASCLPLIFLNTCAGAYLGLALGAWARNRRESGGDLGVLLLIGCGPPMAVAFAFLGAGLTAILLWLYFVAGTCLLFARRFAYAQLS